MCKLALLTVNNNNNNTSICKAHNVSIRAESEAPKNFLLKFNLDHVTGTFLLEA